MKVLLLLMAIGISSTIGRYKYRTPEDVCIIDKGSRIRCGWRGIKYLDCETAGCCFDNFAWKSVWCFTKKPACDCGVPVHQPLMRIVGGVEAHPYSWPWQISLQSIPHWHFCGGTIVHHEWVLTAGHCVHGQKIGNMKIYIKEHNLDVWELNEVALDVAEVILHEGYNTRTLENDIALVRLVQYIMYDDKALPVCIPVDPVVTGTLMTVTGFGSTEGTGTEGVLNEVEVPLIDTSVCREMYPGDVQSGMICAGYLEKGGMDSCQGDSGGPMVAQVNGRWNLYGIVSWGYGCAQPEQPGVYTDVHSFKDWIFQNSNGDVRDCIAL